MRYQRALAAALALLVAGSPAVVAFAALKPPRWLASVFAAANANAARLYATLRAASTAARASGGRALSRGQLIAARTDLERLYTRAQALAHDLDQFDLRLGVT